MYCQACGSAIAHKTKYCNRCGTQLVPAEDSKLDKTPAEKRLDEYLDGLFWISVLGLGFIIGGTVLLTKFGVRDVIVLGYAVLSTIVFLIKFRLQYVWRTQPYACERRQADNETRT